MQHELGSVERANFLKKYSEIKLNEQLSPRAEEEKAGILRSVSTPYLFLDQKINLQKKRNKRATPQTRSPEEGRKVQEKKTK